MEEKELKDKSLNEKESLELITRMIQNTQHRLERHTGMPMLIWGYATTVTTLFRSREASGYSFGRKSPQESAHT